MGLLCDGFACMLNYGGGFAFLYADGLLEFSAYDRIVNTGYDYARETLAAWEQLEQYAHPTP